MALLRLPRFDDRCVGDSGTLAQAGVDLLRATIADQMREQN
jgi:hypothetical protein